MYIAWDGILNKNAGQSKGTVDDYTTILEGDANTYLMQMANTVYSRAGLSKIANETVASDPYVDDPGASEDEPEHMARRWLQNLESFALGRHELARDTSFKLLTDLRSHWVPQRRDLKSEGAQFLWTANTLNVPVSYSSR